MIILPKLLQEEEYDCAKVIRNQICLYYQITPKPLDLTNPIWGTNPIVLEAWLRVDGFKIISGKGTVDDLRYFTSNGFPVATLTNLYGGHYVNVTGCWRNFVYFYDPTVGDRRLRVDEWQLMWTDTDKFNKEYTNYIIVPRP